jgi:hypothetical protein
MTPDVQAAGRRIAITLPADAVADLLADLAKGVNEPGDDVCGAIDELSYAQQLVDMDESERREQETDWEAACQRRDQAVADLLALVGPARWEMSVVDAADLAVRLLNARAVALGDVA